MTHEEVIAHYGDKVKAAAAIGVSVQSVINWSKPGAKIPKLTQLAIQTLTKNKLKAD